ncbi:MAG TPA: hypothetical protein VJS92_13730, partial [Candidatus Polarisedimenticolaceae bacterium]|nr:hypothetical protein [Candidatus Polarisedimenticolaceae bacterium]
MLSSRRWLSVIGLTLVVLGVCGAALAGPRRGGRPFLRAWADRLDLSSDQRREIREIVSARWRGELGEAAREARAAR